MKRLIYFSSILLLINSCEKDGFELTQNANEFFFLRNNGADMPVWVTGNTASKTFILVIHGGPGEGSVGNYNPVKSFKIWQEHYAVVYWDQRAAGNTQGQYKQSTITADQMVEDLEKLVVLIKNKYGADISLFLKADSWGGYLGLAYLTKDNNQENVKGWISESGAHSIPLTGYAELRRMIEFGNTYIQNNIKKDAWTKVVEWCENIDTINNTNQWLEVNNKAYSVTEELLQESIAKNDVDEGEAIRQMVFGSYSYMQSVVNNYLVSESPLAKNLYNLDLSNDLNKVTIPCRFCAGKFDLIVPVEVAYDAYNRVGSEFKEIKVYNKSGHSPSASQAKEFAEDVIQFIEIHK